MNSYIKWQIDNKEHICRIYYMIENTLKKNNIIIIDENNLYMDIVRYLYKIKEN